MKHRLSLNMKKLASELAGLHALDRRALIEKWRSLYGMEPPVGSQNKFLLHAIAYRIQEQASGGLKPPTRRFLEKAAQDNASRQQILPAISIKPGTRLLREWHGVTYEVIIMESGVQCNGKRYRSLSEVARSHHRCTLVRSSVLRVEETGGCMNTKPILRCAIYTRKSSEEGLDQDFNSLHAQREACEAYIASQKHEGWHLVKTHYDDGGFSGGNMERPALKQLLEDIETGKVNVVIVYKVDRLTRSLTDFAKIIERFDKHSVSFVSVTQQFNTTSSMGRLTLNVLLSFAQFEREVTSERIRDKIAASKKKGMWMGGFVPLGYDLKDRKLLINVKEAQTVQYIYRRYLELGCVRLLKEDLDRQGIHSKVRGQKGGCSFSRGTLYRILSNPIYIGRDTP